MSNIRKKYRKRMFGSKGFSKRKARAALNRAHEIRKFEIELLWKRATYAAIFQTLLFAALGLTFSRYHIADGTPVFRLIISIAGIFTSFFWYFINKASRFWHKNWTHHIDLLEDEFEGKLHKTVLHGDGLSYSVSRANIYISLVFFVAWVVLALIFSFDFLKFIDEFVACPVCMKIITLIVLALVVGLFLECCRRKLKTKFQNTGKTGNVYRVNRKLSNHLKDSPLPDK